MDAGDLGSFDLSRTLYMHRPKVYLFLMTKDCLVYSKHDSMKNRAIISLYLLGHKTGKIIGHIYN